MGILLQVTAHGASSSAALILNVSFWYADISNVWSQCQCHYEGLSKSFRTGRLELELQMVQLSATRCSCIASLEVSIVSFAAITLCIASQWVVQEVSIYFVIESVRKHMDTSSNVWRPYSVYMEVGIKIVRKWIIINFPLISFTP
jgi:hypothetical protein